MVIPLVGRLSMLGKRSSSDRVHPMGSRSTVNAPSGAMARQVRITATMRLHMRIDRKPPWSYLVHAADGSSTPSTCSAIPGSSLIGSFSRHSQPTCKSRMS